MMFFSKNSYILYIIAKMLEKLLRNNRDFVIIRDKKYFDKEVIGVKK